MYVDSATYLGADQKKAIRVDGRWHHAHQHRARRPEDLIADVDQALG
jgi:hypothetical protein